MAGYTTENLLRTIKQRGMTPTNQSTWQNEDYLRLATEIMRLDLMGLLVSIHEDYFVTHRLYDIPEGTKSRFRLPERATGMSLKGVYLVDDQDEDRIPVPRLDRNLADYSNVGYRQTQYYLEWNDLVLFGNSTLERKRLRVEYYIEPGQLVDVSRGTFVESVSGNVVTVSSVPSVFSASDKYDLISHTGGREYYDIDIAVSNIDTITNQITFSDDVPSLQVGDVIALSGESTTPQLPNSLQPILAQMTIVEVLESLGFDKQSERMRERAKHMIESAMKTITPRVHGSPKKILSGYSRRLRFD